MLISLFRVNFWFDTVCNIVTRWMHLEKTSCRKINYNYPTTIFAYELFKVKLKIVNNTRNTQYLVQNTSKYCSQTIVVHLEKCFITFCMPLLNFSKTLLHVFKRENDLCNNGFLIHYYLLDPSGVVITLAFQVWVSTPPSCSSRW